MPKNNIPGIFGEDVSRETKLKRYTDLKWYGLKK